MKRLKFLKALFVGGTVAVLPKVASATNFVETFTFDELFEVHQNNDRLIYIKPDSLIYKKIRSVIENRVSSWKDFRYYSPRRDIFIEIKDKYSYNDFSSILLFLTSKYNSQSVYSEYDEGVFFRFIKEDDKRMHLDLFAVK